MQDPDKINYFAGPGFAIREASLKTGFADYLLMVDKKALGVIEAKKVGTTLSGISHQSTKYAAGVSDHIQAWRLEEPLPFRFESTGVETYFTNTLDPEPRSRRVFAFHRPETLREWVQEEETLRGRMRSRLGETHPLHTEQLWPPQIEAIQNLENSLAMDRPRALVHMATGSGMTYSADEALAYDLQALKRAVIVGERTRGGAHLVDYQVVHGQFIFALPTARAVNPVTGANREGSGVTPDIEVPQEEELSTAHGWALARLLPKAKNEEESRFLRWEMESLEARLNPVRIPEERLQRYAGRYADRPYRPAKWRYILMQWTINRQLFPT